MRLFAVVSEIIIGSELQVAAETGSTYLALKQSGIKFKRLLPCFSYNETKDIDANP